MREERYIEIAYSIGRCQGQPSRGEDTQFYLAMSTFQAGRHDKCNLDYGKERFFFPENSSPLPGSHDEASQVTKTQVLLHVVVSMYHG